MRLLSIFFVVIFFAEDGYSQFRRSRDRVATPDIESSLNYANPSEYYLGGIDITGLNILDKNAIISLTGLRVGDKVKVPGDQISGAIRKLWNHGLVGDVVIKIDKIEGDNIFLMIELSERPRLTDYYFAGISNSRQGSLKEELTLIRGKIVNDAMIRNTELSVHKYFRKKGFLNTTVKVIKEPDTLNRGGIKLKIDVDLQSKVRINEIKFVGNSNVHTPGLKGQLKKTKEHPRITLHRRIFREVSSPKKIVTFVGHSYPVTWRETYEFLNRQIKPNVFASSKLIQSDFDDDKKRLVEYYNSLGYRDAEVVSDSVSQFDKLGIDINIKVFEGRKYYFRDITWTGNFLYSANTLNKILDINKGDVYNRELINKKTTFNPKGADISGLYMDDGYLFFRVTPVEVAVEGDSIDLEMRIFEGDQATINRISVSGNNRTNDHVILRELNTVPGQKFRRSDLIRTQQMLSQMGYFDPQKIDPQVMPNPADGTVDINWGLEEQSNDQIELSGGWGGSFGFVGTVGISFNNFSLRNSLDLSKWKPLPFGDGQRLSLRAQANGRSFQSYSLSFTEPWLGGRKPNSFTVSLNRSISRYPDSNFQFSDLSSLKQNGVTLGLGRRLEWPDNYFTLLNSVSFLQYNYSNYFTSSALPVIGRTNNINLTTTLARNSIDNPMYPTSGSTLSLSLILTPPYSLWRDPSYANDINKRYEWVEMHKWMFDAKFYLRILGSTKPEGRSLVLETKAHFGFIGSYTQQVGIGPFERFIMGGDGLAGGVNSFVLGQEVIGLRGYPNNQITPPLYALRGTIPTNQIEGGIVYNKFGLELRYPAVVGQTATIYGFIFGEAGNNWDNYEDFSPFSLYKSAGFGVRLFMPAFGLIGLNWGYGFDTVQFARQPSGAQFHFTIGQQIR